MKVHELSRITGVKEETIRSYRLKGLLRPVQQENGYYDYSIGDYVSLAYLKKLRSCNFSTEDIRTLYESADVGLQQKIFAHESERLQMQIFDLQEKLRLVEFERRHLSECIENEGGALQFQAIDERFDYYAFSDGERSLGPHTIARLYETGTASVRIPREVLNGPCRDERIPIQVGIGSYRYMLEQEKVPVLKNSVRLPNGIYIAQILRLTDLSRMNLLQLRPMMEAARSRGKAFLSDTTAYLMHLQAKDGRMEYYFRVRACIEENQVNNHSGNA